MSVFGTGPGERGGVECMEGDKGLVGRDGGVETGFWGEGESVDWSLRLSIPRGRKGDMVVAVVVGRHGEKEGKEG